MNPILGWFLFALDLGGGVLLITRGVPAFLDHLIPGIAPRKTKPAKPTLEDATERLRALHRKYRAEAFKEWDAEFARLLPPAPYTFEPERFPRGATIHAVDDGENYEIRDFTGRVISRRRRQPEQVPGTPRLTSTQEYLQQAGAAERARQKKQLLEREGILRYIERNSKSPENVALALRLLHEIEEQR